MSWEQIREEIITQGFKKSSPRKREFYNGAKAFCSGAEERHNPWGRTIGGRDYHAFEWEWRSGWRSARAAAEQRKD